MTNNAPIEAKDVAVIFEGGGARCVYTAPLAQALIEHNVKPGWMGGVSAGSTHVVNFKSGDVERCRKAFVDLYKTPEAPGFKTFIKGKGVFNDEYLFSTACQPGEFLELNYDAFKNDDTPYGIGAYCIDTEEMKYWGMEDCTSKDALLAQAKASSSLPFFIPPTTVDGKKYIDGAFGRTAGIPIDAAEDAGFEKMLVVLTRPRSYVREEVKHPKLIKWLQRKSPATAEAMIRRPADYNATKERLLQLEAEGKAYLYFPPEDATLSKSESDYNKLLAAFEEGQAQVEQEWPAIEKFLTSN